MKHTMFQIVQWYPLVVKIDINKLIIGVKKLGEIGGIQGGPGEGIPGWGLGVLKNLPVTKHDRTCLNRP